MYELIHIDCINMAVECAEETRRTHLSYIRITSFIHTTV